MTIYGSDQHTSDESCIASFVPVKPKWKHFAIGHFFSNDLTSEQAEGLFDRLAACNNHQQVESVIKGSGEETALWPEFRNMESVELADAVCALASHAQEIESTTPKIYIVVDRGCVSYVSSTGDVKVNVVDLDVLESGMLEDGEQDVRTNLAQADSLVRYWP